MEGRKSIGKRREWGNGPNALIISNSHHFMLISILCMQQSSRNSIRVCYSVWGAMCINRGVHTSCHHVPLLVPVSKCI